MFLCSFVTTLCYCMQFLIMSVYHLSIFLILSMNFFLWFPVFHVVSLFLTKCTFYLNRLYLILFLVFQYNLIIILFVVLSCRSNLSCKCKYCTCACACELDKSVSCNLTVSSLAKPMFIYLNTVRSLNVCNL